ncbi:hypothetical protein Sste5344_005952 [Sporothrix stenoceras]
MTAARITVHYVGRFPIDWAPQHFVARSLEEAKNDNGLTPTQRAVKANLIRAILDRAEDANSFIKAPLPPHDTSQGSVELHYRYFLQGIIADLQAYLVVPWGNRKAIGADGNSNGNLNARDDEEAEKDDRMRARDAADKRAQTRRATVARQQVHPYRHSQA